MRLKWPTALAINPLDNSLHILDHSIVLKLTADFKLVTVAGRPIYCPLRPTNFLPEVRFAAFNVVFLYLQLDKNMWILQGKGFSL